jgi:hypothetical protein
MSLTIQMWGCIKIILCANMARNPS